MTIVLTCAATVGASAATPTRRDFDAGREALRSPAYMASMIAECAAKLRRDHPRGILQLPNVPAERAPVLYCERYFRAWRDGRYTYELFVKDANADSLDPATIRIIQGR